MRFGETLLTSAIPDCRLHYIDYEGLKRRLYGDKSEAAAVRFLHALEAEFVKVNAFAVARTAAVRGSLEILLKEVALTPQTAVERATLLGDEAAALTRDVVDLDTFVRQNHTGFRKIVKKFDKVLGQRASVWVAARLVREAFCRCDLDGLLHLLSRVYEGLRANVSPAGGAPPTDGAAEQRAVFRRKSEKYWVRPEDQVAVLALCLRHLPIHPPQRPPATRAAGNEAEGNEAIAGWVSSVYLDSPRYDCYHSRLLMEEGATLYRLRSYGDEPAAVPTVFVERKVHHDAWTGERSTKTRMPLDPASVESYLAGGAIDLDAQCASSVAKGELLAADAPTACALGADVQHAVRELGLCPTVRTLYMRCALQQPRDSTVRITLDSSLFVLGETSSAAPAIKLAAGYERSSWCGASREDASAGAASSAWRRFPHAVLELKLGGVKEERPAWLDEVVDSGLLHPVPKFSKYLTGAAALYPTELCDLPDWFGDESLRAFAAPRPSAAPSPPMQLEGKGRRSSSPQQLAPASPTRAPFVRVLATTPRGRAYPTRGRGAAGWLRGRGGAYAPSPMAGVNRSAQRVDPKTFFANERTFIQWLTAAMLMASVGIALIEVKVAQRTALLRDDPTRPPLPLSEYVAGILVITMAVVIILYGLAVYLWRLRRLKRRVVTSYDDPYGPSVLVIGFVAAVVVYTIYQVDAGG